MRRYAGRARPRPGESFKKGDEVLVHERGGKLYATRGLDVIAEFIKPQQEMVDAVECVGGLVEGRVVAIMPIIDVWRLRFAHKITFQCNELCAASP